LRYLRAAEHHTCHVAIVWLDVHTPVITKTRLTKRLNSALQSV